MNKNPEKTADDIEQNNSKFKERFIFLYEGKIIRKKVFYPQLGQIMGIRLQRGGCINMKVQSFCGIDLFKNPHSFVAGVFFIHPVSGKIENHMLLHVLGAERDLTVSYRMWRIFEELSEINIIGNIKLVSMIVMDWKRFTRGAKKQAARDIGISIQKLEKIMEMFPPDLERICPELERYSINISTEPFQKAVLAGKIALTPLLKSLGVKSADEIAKEKEKTHRILELYSEYLKFYYGKMFVKDQKYAQMFANFAIEISDILKSMNIKPEKDIILGIALFKVDYRILEEAMQYGESLIPEEVINRISLGIEGIKAQEKIDIMENVINFLVKTFPETGRSTEEYKRQIFDAMDVIEMSKKV